MIRLHSVFAWILLAPAVLHAAPERSFAELLPEGTVGYFEANALSDAERAKAVAYRCLAEPEMRSALDRLMEEEGNFSRAAIPMGRGTLRVRADIRESGAAFDLEFAHAKGTERVRFRDNMAIAWVGLGEGGPLGIDAVAALHVDGGADSAYRFLRRLLVVMQRRDMKRGTRSASFEEYAHAGVKCTVFDLDGVPVHFAPVGSRLVIATTRARLIDVIDRSKKPAAQSLAGTKRFAETRKHASGDGTIVMLVHLNVDYAVEQLAKNHPQFAAMQQWMAMSGLGGLKSITSTSRAEGGGIAGTTSVVVEGRRVGISRLFEKDDAAKFGTLAFAPKETLYAASGRFNPPSMMRMMAEAAGMLVSSTAQVLYQETGINLYEDIVKVIGPEAALICSTNQGFIPDVGVVFESKDAARLERTVLNALARADWKPGTGVFPTRLAGGKAHVVKVFHPRMSEVPIAPTFGVVDGHFVVTLFPISYQRFANTKRGLRPGIEKNADYVELRKRVPADALSLSYLDLHRAVTTGYDTLIPILQALPQADGQTPIYEMPEASLFTKHLYGRIAWRVADDRGMHWHSHSSIDLTPLVMGAVGAGAAAVTMVRDTHVHGPVMRTKGEPQQAVGAEIRPQEGKMRELRRCSRNVRELLQVLRFYYKRNSGFPDSLDDMGKAWAGVNVRTFQVPGHEGKRYRYFGPRGKGGLLLAGFPNGPDGRICVITTDLKMARFTAERVHEMLEHEPKKR